MDFLFDQVRPSSGVKMRTAIIAPIAVFLMCFTFMREPRAQITENAPPASKSASASTVSHDTAGAMGASAGKDSLPPIDSMPKLIEFVKADYPADLVRKGVEGQVILDLIVDTLGRVDSVAVVKGFDPRLDSSAAAAAMKFRFRPAIAAGVPVPVLMEYAYRFTIDEVINKIERYVNLKGRLLERGTRLPVRDAAVAVLFRDTTADRTLSVPFASYLKKIGSFSGQHVEGFSVITTTDSTGRFSFTSLPAGPITIKVICAGYEQLMEDEKLNSAEVTEVTYHIQRFSTYGDNEIVVYGKAEEKEVAKHTLTLNEVKKIPGFAGDAVKVVQALPGVARASLFGNQIIVRGAANADSRYYLDGMYLPVLFHFGGLKSTYNSDALESVDFYPGGFGTRYGDVTAGVIEIKGRQAKTDRIHASVDANFYDASFMVEGPVTDKISTLLTARRSFIGDILSWAVTKLELPVSIQPYYWDYIWRTDYVPGKNQKFYLTLFGSQDYFKLIASSFGGRQSITNDPTNQADQRTFFNMGIVGWNWDISPNLKNTFTYGLTYGDEYASFFGMVKVDQNTWYNNLRDDMSISVTKNAVLHAGLDAIVYPVNFEFILQGAADTVTRDTLRNWVFGDIGPYLSLDWKPLERLEIIPGLRYDYFPELKYRGSIVPAFWNYNAINNRQGAPGEPSARLTMRYKLTPAHTIKAAVGNYSQTPQPLGQTIMQRWGDPNLPATKGAQYVGGYEWKLTDLDNADIQVYYNNQWDIPRQGTAQDVPAGQVPRGFYADELGRMYGLEIMLKHDQGKRFFGWIAYSLSRSERRDPHTGIWSLYGKDETHNLQLIGSYRLPKFWEVGCRVRYVTGDPTTPISGIGYNEDVGRFFALYGPRNSSRFDPFFQLDMRVEKKFMMKNWVLTSYLDFQDLSWFVYKSPEFYMYNYRYDQKTPVGGIPYPSIGLSAEF
jgi:TonB family protein